MGRPQNPPKNVVSLTASEPETKGPGRPPKLDMPPMPQEVLDGMTAVERQHFDHFRAAYFAAFRKKYGTMTPTGEICITQAALDYVHLWRLQANQMVNRELISQARQHPGTSMREWLRAAGLQDKDLEQPKQADDNKSQNKATLLKLSS